jgi:iron complex outermembrane receptor protein
MLGERLVVRILGLASVAAMGFSAVVTAQETALEEVVIHGQLSRYSALKSETPILETARSVSIESLQQIIDKGAQSLDDVYTYSAGVLGETYGFATRGDWVRVRGLEVPQYQDSLQSLFGNYNNTRPDIYTLEQVEILKGPASVLYGQGSPGGIVNVISKRPQEEASRELLLEYGTNEHKRIAADFTGALTEDGRWLYRTVLSYKDTGTQVDHVDDQTLVINHSIAFRPNEDTQITLLLNYTDSDSDTAAQFLPVVGTLTPAPNGRFLDTSTYVGEPGFNFYKAKTSSVTLLAEHTFNETWSMEATARYTDAEADYQQIWLQFFGAAGPWAFATADGLVPRTFFHSVNSSEQLATDIRFRADFDTGALEHNVLIGLQYQDVTVKSGRAYARLPLSLTPQFGLDPFNPVYGSIVPADQLAAIFTQRPDTDTVDRGLYISDQISWENWRFTLGMRYDSTKSEESDESQSDNDVNAAAGVLYLFDNGLAPYVSYSQSFNPVIGLDANGDLFKPEEGEQIELGLKYQPDGVPVVMTLAYFDLEQSNLRVPSPDVPGEEIQTGEVAVEGYELEVQAQFGDFSLELNATKLDTENQQGARMDSVAEEQASLWLGYKPEDLLPGFRAGFGVRYVGESWDGFDVIRTPSHTLYDLMLGYEVGAWNFGINSRNLGDKVYMSTCLLRGDCFPGDRRTVVGSVRYSF